MILINCIGKSLLAVCVRACIYIYIISANNLKIIEQSKTSVFLPIIISGIAAAAAAVAS